MCSAGAARALVGPVIVEMPDELIKDRAGVAFVVDQQVVSAFFADTAHEPFGVQFARGVRGGIFTTSMPSEANTASNAAVNLESRSRIRKRKAVIRSRGP